MRELVVILLIAAGCGGSKAGRRDGATEVGGAGGDAGPAGDAAGDGGAGRSGDAAPGDGGGDRPGDAVQGDGAADEKGVVCGTERCRVGFVCCAGCGGGSVCQAICGAVMCPPPDAGGGQACGAMTCGAQQACVHPAPGGTCVRPDAGSCPAGTSNMAGCCLPPDRPTCVTVDRACPGTLSCSCFSSDPCAPYDCAGATVSGRDIVCRGA